MYTNFEDAPHAAPATVHDKANVGRVVRYYLRFDDGVVRGVGAGGAGHGLQHSRRQGCKAPRIEKETVTEPGMLAKGSTAARLHAEPLPPRPAPPQDVDFVVGRRLDEERYDMDVGQRVFVEAPPSRLMGFDYPELDGTAVVA